MTKQPGAGRHRSGSSAAERRTVFRRSPVRIRSTTCPCPSSPTWQRRRLQVPKVPGSNPGRGTTRHGSITGGDPGKGGCDNPPPRERYSMHGSRKGYPGDRVPQWSKFRWRRGRRVLTLTQTLRRRSAHRRTRIASRVRGNTVRARQARAVPMRSESGRRIGARTRAQRLGGQVRGCEAFGGPKGHGTSWESTSSVEPNTSSIGRAIAS